MFKKIFSYIALISIIFSINWNIFIINTNASLSNKNATLSNVNDYASDRLIVKYKWDIAYNNYNWISEVENFSNVSMSVLNINSTEKSVEDLKSELESNPKVEFVEYDYKRSINYTWVETSDTRSDEQWFLESISADKAWEMYNDDENKITVSVNDTWINYNHEDLSWNLKNLTSSCKDETWDLVAWWCPNSGLNFWNTTVFEDNDIYDKDWHGSHVAWIIWAVKDNNKWVVWVTQNVELIWARLDTYHQWYGLFYVSNTIEWINFAINNWAKVINASYGWPNFSQAEYDAIETAKDNWVLMVIAAWNNWSDNDWWSHFYPSDYDLDNIISVASLGEDDTLSYFSNYWLTSVDIAAPGWDLSKDSWILSTYTHSEEIWNHSMDNFTNISTTWTGWNIYNNEYIETQSWAFSWASSYTWSENKTLTFDETFDLSWAKYAEFEWHIECELWTWDDLIVSVNWNPIWYAAPFLTYNRSQNFWNVKLEIPSNLYTSNSELSLLFYSNDDLDVSYWCSFDDFKIRKYDWNQSVYKSIQWTSMAAPVVTWLVTMIWSYKPELTYLEVKDIIYSSLDSLAILSWKTTTWWKINAENAIKELINRYWITKSWSFWWEQLNISNIDLNNKTLTLSWTTLNISWTWNVINLNNSNISWTWIIDIELWTSVKENNNELLTSWEDFSLILKDKNNNLLSSWAIVKWDKIIVSHTWVFSWNNLTLELFSNYNWYTTLYNWIYSNNLEISLNESFSWNIKSKLYLDWKDVSSLDNWIKIDLLNQEDIIANFDFEYIPSNIEWNFSFSSWSITNNTETSIELESNFYPVDYQISWDLVKTYTWTLSSTWNVSIELSSWDWIKSLTWIFVNSNWDTSPIFSWSIELDTTAPIVNIWSNIEPLNPSKSINFSISSLDDDLDYNSILWINTNNWQTSTWLIYSLSWFTDNNLGVNVSYSDIIWNTWSVVSTWYILDNTAPIKPFNISVNNWDFINTNNVNNSIISGSWNLSDSWSIVNYIFSESIWNNSVYWSWILNWESFEINSINFSSLSDWNIDYSIYFTDSVWNISDYFTWIVLKESISPIWSIYLDSHTNKNIWNIIIESSEYPVDFTITWDLNTTMTWTLSWSWIVDLPFTSWEWQKNINVILSDSWNNNSPVYTWSIILDQTKPVINFISFTDLEKTELSEITLTWTLSDNFWVSELIINNLSTSFDNWFSRDLSLSWWLNEISFIVNDIAWNTNTWSLNIIRTAVIENIYKEFVWTWSIDINVESNLDSITEVLYWTWENDLLNSLYSTEWTNNTININWLSPDTTYYFKARWNIDSYTWELSELYSFSTPKSLDISNINWNNSNTGSLIFEWWNSSSTWVTFNSTWTLNIINENWLDSVELSLSWLTISSDSWDLMFNPPEKSSFSWSFSSTWYINIPELTYDIWSNSSELSLTWSSAKVKIYVWDDYNWQNIWVFRSLDNWVTYNYLESCNVLSWYCEFSTDKFSLYTFWLPSDTTPDSFSFIDVSSATKSTEYISNEIIISWINTWSTISIQNWYYSINSTSYTNLEGIVYSWDKVKIKATSSSSSNWTINVTLNVWGVTDIYTIKTKSYSSWWGGGWWGWWWSASVETCKIEKLICKQSNSWVFRYYRQDWYSCNWWDLWNTCTVDNNSKSIKDKENTINLEEKIYPLFVQNKNLEFKNSNINKIFNSKKDKFILLERDLVSLNYLWERNISEIKYDFRKMYSLWIDNLEKIEVSIEEKNKDNIKKYLNINNEYLEKLENYFIDNNILYKEISWEKIYYFKLKNNKINKVQELFYKKLDKKVLNKVTFVNLNKVLADLDYYLENKNTLSKKEKIELKKDILKNYKKYKATYRLLKNKSININNNIKNDIKKVENNESINTKEMYYYVSVYSVKLKKDENLKYHQAWLSNWDKLELIRQVNDDWLLEVRIVDAAFKAYNWRTWYIYAKYLALDY